MKTLTSGPHLLALSLMLSLLHTTSPASAQAESKAAAREHFEKGVAAFEDKRFGEAAEEFDAAYRISPAFAVLYNIGQVNVALGRSVEAVDAFDRYLKQGASVIPAGRRAEVQTEIEKQLGRIGTVVVRTVPTEAEVRVDGRLIPKTGGRQTVRVTAGRHTVEAMLVGHTTQVREIDVRGKSEMAFDLSLEAVVAPSRAPVTPPPPVAAIAPPPAPSPAAGKIETRVIEKEVVERTVVERPDGGRAPQPQPARRGSPWNWQRIAGVVIAVGGVAIATEGGLMAFHGANQASTARDILANPPSDKAYDAALVDFNNGKHQNQKGWTIAGIGAAVSLGGILLVATAPDRVDTLAFAPWMTADAGGLVARGPW